MDDLRIRKAGDLLSHIIAPEAVEEAKGWARFFSSWKGSVGEQLAAHSRPVDARNGIVIIEADHPGWIQMLQMRQERLLDTLRKAFPELKLRGIAFRLAGDTGRPPVRDTQSSSRTAEDADSGSEAAQDDRPAKPVLLDGVQDAAFRELLSSLADTLGNKGKRKKAD